MQKIVLAADDTKTNSCIATAISTFCTSMTASSLFRQTLWYYFITVILLIYFFRDNFLSNVLFDKMIHDLRQQ